MYMPAAMVAVAVGGARERRNGRDIDLARGGGRELERQV